MTDEVAQVADDDAPVTFFSPQAPNLTLAHTEEPHRELLDWEILPRKMRWNLHLIQLNFLGLLNGFCQNVTAPMKTFSFRQIE